MAKPYTRWSIVFALVVTVGLMAASAAAQPIHISMVSWTPRLGSIVDAFNSVQDEVVIEFHSESPYRDSVVAMHAAGVAPTIIHMNPDDTAVEFYRQGMIRPIDDLIGRDDLDLSGVLEGAWAYAFYEGKQYGWPMLGSPLPTTGTSYNRDHFLEAGVAFPTTWTYQEFVDIAKRLTKDENGDGTPERYGTDSPVLGWNWDWIWTNGGRFIDDHFQNVLLDQPEAYEGLQRMADLSLAYGVAPAYGSSSHDFRKGQTSISFQPPLAAVPAYQKQITFDWGVAQVPSQDAGSVGRGGSLIMGISTQADSPEVEAAWKFFKWIIKPETERMLVEARTPLIPVNRSVLLDPSYWRLNEAPYDLRGYLGRKSRRFPFFKKWDVLRRELAKALPPVLSGDVSARNAMEDFTRSMNAEIRSN